MGWDSNQSLFSIATIGQSKPRRAGGSIFQDGFLPPSGQPTTGFGLRTYVRPPLGGASSDVSWVDGSAKAPSFAMIQGMLPWKQESLEDWGESFMGDLLATTPGLKRAPSHLQAPRRLPNAGGWSIVAVTDLEGGQLFRFDWHPLPAKGRRANKMPEWVRGRSLPHYHAGETKALLRRHRPWEKPPGDIGWGDRF